MYASLFPDRGWDSGSIRHPFRKTLKTCRKLAGMGAEYRRNHLPDNFRNQCRIKPDYAGELCPILVIVDTKAKFSGLNENDNALISQEINKYEALVKDRGANLILLHHTTKNNGYYRGASSFLDSLRWGIQLSPVDSEIEKLCDIPNDEMDLYFVLENSKQNYSRKQKPVLIKRVDNYWFEAMNINWKSNNKAKLDRDIELIKDYMLSKGNTGFTQHALQKELCKNTEQISNHCLYSAIQVGLEMGVFVNEGKRNRQKLKVSQEPINECSGSEKIED